MLVLAEWQKEIDRLLETREAWLLAAFDILGDNEVAGILRDVYGIVSDDTKDEMINEIILEIERDYEYYHESDLAK